MRYYIDQDTGEHVLQLDQPGRPVIRTATLRAMEEVLDYLDNAAEEIETAGCRET